MIYIDAQWASLLVAIVLPVVVAFVKAKGASAAWGAWILAILSAVTAVLTAFITKGDGGMDPKTVAILFIETFVVAAAAHFGFWKPVGTTGANGLVESKVPGGLGAPKEEG